MMKYFEVHEPYYALLKAENEDDALLLSGCKKVTVSKELPLKVSVTIEM